MVSTQHEVRSMLTRMVDFLKTQQISAMLTSLTVGSGPLEAGESDVSSLMDSWVLLRTIEIGGERNRALYVLKSRGMDHSNQIREFRLTNGGLRLLDVYLGPEGVLTGAARVTQEGRERAAGTSRRQQVEGRGRELDRKRQIFEARMTALRAGFEVEEETIQQSISESKLLDDELLKDRKQMVRSREADVSAYKREGSTPAARRR
jgi:circadian clock protein KaiC